MYAWHPPRTLSAGASLAIVVAIFASLLFGLNIRQTVQQATHLVSVDLTQPPPPPVAHEQAVPKPHERKPAPKHEASPRNIRDQATAVVVPPVQPLIPPPPVVTAPKAGVGAAANNGASDLRGPGQGAGGIGNGLGGGGLGGEGDGSGDGRSVVGPRQTAGKMSYRDLPEGVLGEGQEASVDVLFLVEPAGTVGTCRVERSSGYAVLDTLACRLIQQRFRFKPAKDRYGRPVRAWVAETHTWFAREA
jgi:protein TonB